MIPIQILEDFSCEVKFYSKDRMIFNEGDSAQYYYQIQKGKVKMFNLTEEGKEFVQGFFKENMSFGEPPLFGDFDYPASAWCQTDCHIYVLPKASFLELLKSHPEVLLKFTQLICKRMAYKAQMVKEVSIYPPEHSILTLLNYLKKSSGEASQYEVKLTRQEISELTGLRVETVIRAIKKLEKSKELSIIDRKVFI